MKLICELAAPFVANGAADGDEVVSLFRGHVSTCLQCQARHALMSRTSRELSVLRDLTLTAPQDLEWRVLTALEGRLIAARAWLKPVAWSAAALSVGAAAAVLVRRPRPSS